MPGKPKTFDEIDTARKNVQGLQNYMKSAKQMMMYYNNAVLTDKKAVEALTFYKSLGYFEMNRFLLEDLELKIPMSLEAILKANIKQVDGVDSIAKQRKKAMVKFVKFNIKPLVNHISKLDELILNAPKMFTVPTNLYRGMSQDIDPGLECVDGKYFYTFKNYTSASFTPSVSKRFGSVLYTLILDGNCKGVYVNFFIRKNTNKFQDLSIDDEAEFIIGRGARFEVVSVEILPIKRPHMKYKDIACRDVHIFSSKHYILRFVSQPSRSELDQELQRVLKETKSTMLDRATFTI
jgi:hypothetical protein